MWFLFIKTTQINSEIKFINIITKMTLKYFFLLIAIFAYKIDEVKTLARVDENCP